MRSFISSPSNELIKKILVLQSKSRVRKKEGIFVVEGAREISLALEAGIAFREVLVCEEIAREKDLLMLQELFESKSAHGTETPEQVGISRKVYERVAHRKTTEGIIGMAVAPKKTLGDLQLGDNPLLLVAEASEKPGNVGALLRTADAANLDGVIIANPLTDLYNPNIIRSSMGCVFTQQVVSASSPEVLAFLKEHNIKVLSAALVERSKPYYEVDCTGPTAIVVGTEATGLSAEWLDGSDETVIIPMEGTIDSLNVSVSAAILIFEAKRQRAALI